MLEPAWVVQVIKPINEGKDAAQKGITNPYIARFITESGKRFNGVLKLNNPDGVNAGFNALAPVMVAREYVSNVVLQKLGCSPPKGYIAIVVPEWIHRISPNNEHISQLLSYNNGYHFATEYLENHEDLIPRKRHLPEQYKEDAKKIYSSDHLIYNLDRSRQKPNIMHNGKDTLVPIDHGLAFSKCGCNDAPKFPIFHEHTHVLYSTFMKWHDGSSPETTSALKDWVINISTELISSLRESTLNRWPELAPQLENMFDYMYAHDTQLDQLCTHLKAYFHPANP